MILWANNYLCTIFLADDSESWPYRTVKRLHIVIHIVRCMVGMCAPALPRARTDPLHHDGRDTAAEGDRARKGFGRGRDVAADRSPP